MGRKAKGRRGAEDEEKSEASLDSSTAPNSNMSYGDDGDERSGGGLADALEQLEESRATTREHGLNEAIALLTSADAEAQLDGSSDTLTSQLLQNMRRAGQAELLKTLRLLSIVAVHVGADQDEWFRSVHAPLRKLMTRNSDEQVRAAAVECLAICCFVCVSDDNISREVFDDFESVVCQCSEAHAVTPIVQCAAVDAWSLLATTSGTEAVLSASKDRVAVHLVEMLESDDLESRTVAGECLALLYELASNDWDEMISDEVVLSRCMDRLQQLSNDSSKRMSKRDRKQQRSAFRTICASVLEDEPCSEEIKMHGNWITIEGWSALRQANALRSVFQDAFHVAVQHYEIVQDILDLDDSLRSALRAREATGADRVCRVDKGSRLARQRSDDRTKARAARQAFVDYALNDG